MLINASIWLFYLGCILASANDYILVYKMQPLSNLAIKQFY